jgi:hypothetical protein
LEISGVAAYVLSSLAHNLTETDLWKILTNMAMTFTALRPLTNVGGKITVKYTTARGSSKVGRTRPAGKAQ